VLYVEIQLKFNKNYVIKVFYFVNLAPSTDFDDSTWQICFEFSAYKKNWGMIDTVNHWYDWHCQSLKFVSITDKKSDWKINHIFITNTRITSRVQLKEESAIYLSSHKSCRNSNIFIHDFGNFFGKVSITDRYISLIE
jgi:hypothetical protein